MPNPTWHFKTVLRWTSTGSTHCWKWCAESEHGDATQSTNLFQSLADCVRDAQAHGFRGRVDVDRGDFTPEDYEITISGEGTVVFTPASETRDT